GGHGGDLRQRAVDLGGVRAGRGQVPGFRPAARHDLDLPVPAHADHLVPGDDAGRQHPRAADAVEPVLSFRRDLPRAGDGPAGGNAVDLVRGDHDGGRAAGGVARVPSLRALRAALDLSMGARVRVEHLTLDVPAFLQRERAAGGWAGLFLGAAFDPPKRRLLRLLDDISFELREGDRLAILGRNGAGKSTLLRVLNRVYQPSSGSISIEGSCQALLNISLGFNGEATVRENIYLRGIAMGLDAAFLRGQIPQILEFSGLREKVNHRLRTLSTGQKMRLGFAISTSVQHDIIMMDEWVGAGDAEFMRKA